jgi:phosphoadenosine phosphosulfate reductase
VYTAEIELIGRLLDQPLMLHPQDLVLWRSGRTYYAGGRRLARVVGGGWLEKPRLHVYDEEYMKLLQGRRPGRRPKWLSRDISETRALLSAANTPLLTSLEEEAIGFLREVRRDHVELPMAVSWSGGKDSSIVSVLTQRAFPDEQTVHIFADTTNELPCTYEYLEHYRQYYPTTPFVVGYPNWDFLDLCREIGPPSRIQRWCCSTQKAAPLAEALRSVASTGRTLVVSGLRRSESRRRQDYKRVNYNGKIGLQILANPIVDWDNFAVWLWTELQDLPMNEGYRFGFDRIGCAFCPIAPSWSDMIAAGYYDGCFSRMHTLLLEMGIEAGLQNPEQYVISGAWRNRRGGAIGKSGLPNTHVYDITSSECRRNDLVTYYQTTEDFKIGKVRELLKVFGNVTSVDESTDEHIYSVSGIHGDFTVELTRDCKLIRVRFANLRCRQRLMGTLRSQFRKLQACVGCGACAAMCPHKAITSVGPDYRISEADCVHCLNCVRNLKAGCIAADSLHARLVNHRE